MPGKKKAKDFKPHVNTMFKIGEIELKLIEVEELPQRENVPDEVRTDPFSLIFEGPATPVQHQDTYTVSHPKMDDIALFVVPIVGGGQEAMHYQIVFG